MLTSSSRSFWLNSAPLAVAAGSDGSEVEQPSRPMARLTSIISTSGGAFDTGWGDPGAA